MKKLFLLIYTFGSFISINAQNKFGYIEKLDSVITFQYTGVNWDSSFYYKYHIDGNGIFNNYKEFIWFEPDNVLQQANYDYQYDSKGNLANESQSYFIDNQWHQVEKTNYVYDHNNQLVEKTSYRKDDDLKNWLITQREILYYDTNNLLIKTTDSILNYMDLFIKYSEITYTYNNANKVIEKNERRWNESFKKYENKLKYDYTYLVDLYLLEMLRSVWLDDTKSWYGIDKQEYSLDANLNTNAVYNSDWWDSVWVYSNKTEYTFDLNTKLENVAFPFYVPYFYFDIYNKPTSFKNYSYNKYFKEWEISDSSILIYTDINTTSGISKAKNNYLVKAYPNPASEYVNFDLSDMRTATEIQIFDINGKQVLKHDVLNNNSQINISQLNKGFYLCKIISDENISSGKLIVE